MITVFRKELKYMMDYADSILLQAELKQLLRPDKYAGYDYYKVRSLYFDTINHIDFLEKLDGIERRKKIRMRIYNSNQDVVKFEIKEKSGRFQNKSSLLISKADAYRCILGKYDVLHRYGADADRLYSMLILGGYCPAVMIEYERKAYVYPDFNIRMTFDRNLRYCRTVFDLWEMKVPFCPITGNEGVVLEVKYNDYLLESVKRILAKYHLTNVSFSKYANTLLSMEA